MIKNGTTDGNSTPARPRPLSPNIQIYRPQLTSVLSIANRITGLILSLGAVGLVIWLSAAAAGPQAYGVVQSVIGSWAGQVALFGYTFAFLHLCGGIRHLVWDTVHGFELRSIYISGWTVVVSSVALTVIAWVISLLIAGWHPMNRRSFRSPLARALGLGSAKSGAQHWWAQRVSAIALVPLCLWFVVSIVTHAGSDYAVFVAWIRTPLATSCMILLLVALFIIRRLVCRW